MLHFCQAMPQKNHILFYFQLFKNVSMQKSAYFEFLTSMNISRIILGIWIVFWVRVINETHFSAAFLEPFMAQIRIIFHLEWMINVEQLIPGLYLIFTLWLVLFIKSVAIFYWNIQEPFIWPLLFSVVFVLFVYSYCRPHLVWYFSLNYWL